jgi:serine protease Do
MKQRSIIIVAIIALLPVAVLAQNPPTPPAPPAPPAPPGMPGRHEHEKGPKVPMIFLGVETSEVPSVVSEQLGLAKGFGLVVDYVVPDSPAAAAGIKQNDILKMLNDQLLIEPNQLRKLLQTFSDGTDVTLTILRKGQEQKITVKLTKKEMPQRHSFVPGFNRDWNWNFDEAGDNFREQMENLKEQLRDQLGEAQQSVIRDAVMKAREAAKRAREDVRRATRGIRILSNDDGALRATKIDIGKAQIVFSDDKGELKLETVAGKKLLTAKDPQGKLIFSGPVETQQEIDQLPAEVRERYDKLQQNGLPVAAPPSDIDQDEFDDVDDEVQEPAFL